jgi:hypothetical protein
LSAFARVRIAGETFQEKDILDHLGKMCKLLFLLREIFIKKWKWCFEEWGVLYILRMAEIIL